MSDRDGGTLIKAANKAATQVEKAATTVLAGAPPPEAFDNHVKDGPDDLIGELGEVAARGTREAKILVFHLDDQILKFRVSSSGRILEPVFDDVITPGQGVQQKARIAGDDKDVRKARERVGKASETTSTIIKVTNLPHTAGPGIQNVIVSGIEFLQFLPALVQLAVTGWVRRTKKEEGRAGGAS